MESGTSDPLQAFAKSGRASTRNFYDPFPAWMPDT